MIYNQQGDIITQPLENLIMLYNNIIAKIFGFKQYKFFSTEESEREIVKASF
jgi:hypothetical protein